MYPELVREKIRSEGYAIEALLGDELSPVAAYTLGLSESCAHAEIIVLTHCEDQAQAILKEVAGRILKGLVLVPAAVLDDVGKDPLRVLPVHSDQGLRLCKLYRWLYRKPAREALFFQLQIGQTLREAGRVSHIFPDSEDQDVRQYVERTCI